MPLHQFEFTFESSVMEQEILVQVDYDVESGPVYDSPHGALGVSDFVANERVTAIENEQGRDILSSMQSNLAFAAEVIAEILKRHITMIVRVK